MESYSTDFMCDREERAFRIDILSNRCTACGAISESVAPLPPGDYHLPILSHTERRDAAGAKIYPFNAVTVDWFVKTEISTYADVIIVPVIKAADSNGGGKGKGKGKGYSQVI